jgi:hypothetical protein
MPIALRCGCGRKFSVAEDHPGTKVRCPTCADLVDLPGRAEKVQGYALAQFRKCPHCKREWPGEPVVCIGCGWNFQTGKQMKTLHQVKTEEFRLGWGEKATFMRDQRGKVTLTLTSWHFFFFKRSRTYRLSDYNVICTDYTVGSDDVPDIYSVDIEGPGARTVNVYTGPSDNLMREIIAALEEWGQFEVKRR